MSFTAFAVAAAVSAAAFAGGYDVYLLVGQSNMAGRGKMAEAPSICTDRVLKFDTNCTWTAAVEPVHWDGGRAGFGPGLAFGRAMADASPGRTVALVPCAVGGASLGKWMPGRPFYSNAVARARKAMENGTLKGVIWHQGEADSWDGKSADTYGVRLEEMVAALRRDLNAQDAPFVAGEVAPFYADSMRRRGGTPHVDTVNARMREAIGRMRAAGYVTVEGLTHGKNDDVHFDPASAAELGRRYAKEMLRLQAAAAERGIAKGKMWGVLIHLGMNQWHDHYMSEIKRAGVWAKCPGEEFLEHIRAQFYTADRVRFDESVWKEVSARYAADGVNTIVLDLGEAVVYPSHPELAVEGSWPPAKLKAELARLRGMGFEVLPKLNFSTSHDAWLKDYGRMVSTREYYKVCADVIRDVCEMFGRPRLFHIGFDEERPQNQARDRIMIVRQRELWWHDLGFVAGEVERNGARAWMWVDNIVKEADRSGVYSNLPRSILVSPWYYQDEYDPSKTWQIKAMHDLLAHGYEMVPCGSNCYFTDDSMERLVSYCTSRFGRDGTVGYLCAPWLEMNAFFKDRLVLAGESVRRAREIAEK